MSVAEGGVSWVEITVDGTSAVAETKTGPWSETYTVTDTIKIEASDPSVVTVTENGEKKSFDKKASGVGTLTIQGVPLEETMWYSQANGDHYDDEGNHYTNWADAMASQQ